MSRVFISSTYQDLIEHRKAVTDVLTRMKQEYSSMEFFGSRTDEAVLACENGRGKSVEKFRRANIDGETVNRLMRHAENISRDPNRILASLENFTDEEMAMITYAISLTIETGVEGSELRKAVVRSAQLQEKIDVLVGELMRRKPDLLQ